MGVLWRSAAWAAPMTLAATAAMAAGYAIKEQSGTALGNAFAGASSAAEDASYMFFNPASVGRLDGIHADFSLYYISITSELKDASASNPLNTAGSALSGDTDLGDVGSDAVLPAIYGTAQITDEIRLGLGINVPFGLATEYSDDWAGRYHAVKSEVKSVNINPVIAYNPVPQVSLAAGLQFQYIEAELSNAVDFATVATSQGAGSFPAGALDGFAEVDGDDTAFGFTLGAIAEPVPGTKLGIGYRSSIDHELQGDADFTVPAALVSTQIGQVFSDTGATAGIETPAMLNMGITQDIGEQLSVMAEAQWTQWSKLDELVIEFDNSVPDNVTEEDWDDQWFLALGATYKPAPGWAVRVGVAYDQKPLDAKRRTPRLLDNDRYWVATGVSFSPNDMLSFDLGYTHIFMEDSDVRLRAADTGNNARGDLDASFESEVDIIALAARVKF